MKLEDNSSVAFSGAEIQTSNFAVELLLTMIFDTTLAEILEVFADVDMPILNWKFASCPLLYKMIGTDRLPPGRST